jgi:AraC-like DNA-binding protein
MKNKNPSLPDRVIIYIMTLQMKQLKEITVDELTRQFRISKTSLINKFKIEKGFTPGQFILQEKMIRSIILMKTNPHLTIKRLTKIMGFSSCDYYIRLFKDYFGLSPNHYKEIRYNRPNHNFPQPPSLKKSIYISDN